MHMWLQRTVGTVIKADEEEDAVGVASVLSTARHGGLESMKQVQSFMFDHCPKGQLTEQLLQVHSLLLRSHILQAAISASQS